VVHEFCVVRRAAFEQEVTEQAEKKSIPAFILIVFPLPSLSYLLFTIIVGEFDLRMAFFSGSK
jgi:hypothetical protein